MASSAETSSVSAQKNAEEKNISPDTTMSSAMPSQLPTTIPNSGLEKGFYKFMMNPMMDKLEESVRENNAILDEMNRKLQEEREQNRKKQLSKHIPEAIQGNGQELKDVMQHLEDLIVFENYDRDEKDEEQLVKASLKVLDENAEVAILSHSIAAYVSTLEPSHLKHLATKVVNDTTHWVTRFFRFMDGAAYFHEEEKEGIVRVCRLALHNKYPKFSTDGYEALYSRPPVFYVSAAAKPSLAQHLQAQLGLPVSCLCTVPSDTSKGFSHKMDLVALERLIADDKASGKTPMLVIAYAGTPLVGHTDNIKKLQELCKTNEMWLHLEGNNLATLALFSVPTSVVPAKSGDSMTVNLGGWLGLPSVPYVTLYKTSDPALARSAGLASFNARYKLNCLPLWVCLQNLGHEGVVARIQYSIELSKTVHQSIETMPSIFNVTVFEMQNPTVVFRYQEPTAPDASSSVADGGEDESVVVTANKDPYFDALNIWLSETLRRDVPRVHVAAVEIEGVGVSIRYAPMESSQLFDTTREDLEQFIECLQRQLAILDATVGQRRDFYDIVEGQDNMKVVTLANWAGLGAVQYIPDEFLDKLENLSDQAKKEVNQLNTQIVHQLKSADTAFSLGQTEDGLYCTRFGLITEETDLEELIGLVYTTGKSVEESSKFLEKMAEIVKEGIHKAEEDIVHENESKLYQEGVLRHVPVFGSLINWWSPPPKDPIKGRAFNLSSGKVESTETTYKYHMQVQENVADNSPKVQEGPLKNNLKPRRSDHNRSMSETSSITDSEHKTEEAAVNSLPNGIHVEIATEALPSTETVTEPETSPVTA